MNKYTFDKYKLLYIEYNIQVYYIYI